MGFFKNPILKNTLTLFIVSFLNDLTLIKKMGRSSCIGNHLS